MDKSPIDDRLPRIASAVNSIIELRFGETSLVAEKSISDCIAYLDNMLQGPLPQAQALAAELGAELEGFTEESMDLDGLNPNAPYEVMTEYRQSFVAARTLLIWVRDIGKKEGCAALGDVQKLLERGEIEEALVRSLMLQGIGGMEEFAEHIHAGYPALREELSREIDRVSAVLGRLMPSREDNSSQESK